MINEVIRERVAASGFAPEHVDMVAERLTNLAVGVTADARQSYIDAAANVSGAGNDSRFQAVLSIALGQPTSDARPGRAVQSYRAVNGQRIGFLSRAEIESRYSVIAGLTDDPVIVDGADPFPFRFVPEAPATVPAPLEYGDDPDDPDDEDDNECSGDSDDCSCDDCVDARSDRSDY